MQQSAVDVVLSADVAAQRAEREADALQEAVESGDVGQMAAALRALRLQRLEVRRLGLVGREGQLWHMRIQLKLA